MASCTREVNPVILNEVRAGQVANMDVHDVPQTLVFSHPDNELEIDVFGDDQSSILIRLEPYNVMSGDHPKVLLMSDDVEFDMGGLTYYISRDSSFTPASWDGTQYVAQLDIRWNCSDSLNGSPVVIGDAEKNAGHMASLLSNWRPLDEDGLNLLEEGGSYPPSSTYIGDTLYHTWTSALSCSKSFRSRATAYYLFKAKRGNDNYLGWIQLSKLPVDPNGNSVDSVLVNGWAVTQNPVEP